jgi:uncharacterized membrane protein
MLLWVLLTGCEGKSELEAPVDCAGYDWDTVGAPYLLTWCTPCHSQSATDRGGAPAGVDFDSHEGVLAWLDRVEQRAVVDQDMPPMGGPFPEELAAFETWIACGAP